MKREVQNSAFPGMSGSTVLTVAITGIDLNMGEMATWGKGLKTENFGSQEVQTARDGIAAQHYCGDWVELKQFVHEGSEELPCGWKVVSFTLLVAGFR